MRTFRYADLLSLAQITELFGVNSETIAIWRFKEGMPTCTIPGRRMDRMRFNPPDVLNWAIRNGKRLENAEPLLQRHPDLTPLVNQVRIVTGDPEVSNTPG